MCYNVIDEADFCQKCVDTEVNSIIHLLVSCGLNS